MQRRDFWYNAEAQKIGAIPTGCRAGQFLFLSAQTPVDLDTGELVRYPWDLPREGRDRIMTGWEFYDAKHGPIRAQTWMIYHNLSKILAQQGSGLNNIIRQRVYLRDVRDTGPMEEVMLTFFPEEKPATTIMGVADHCTCSDIRVQVEVIALVPEKRGLRKETVYLPELASLTAPYPQAVKVGQFLFTSGLTATDPATGKVVTKIAELGREAKKVESGNRQSDATAEATKSQYWFSNIILERIAKSQGATLKDSLRYNQFYRWGMKELADYYPLRRKLFKTREATPPTTAFGMRNLSIVSEAVIQTDAIILLPGEYQKVVDVVPDRTAGFYPMWAKAGPLWFVSGDLGLDTAHHCTIQSFADLPDAGRFLAHGRFDDVHIDVMAQAWFIYQSLDRQMRDAGSELAKVAQQNIYVRDVCDYAAVERVSSLVYQGAIPPTTVIPVDDIGPYESLRLEIETISLV